MHLLRVTYLSILLTSLSHPAFADVIQEQQQAEVQANRADPRAGKRFTFGLEPLGFPVLLPSVGATLGVLLKPTVALELNHARSSVGIRVLQIYSRVTSLRAKVYLTRSFYVNAGLGYRTLGARFTLDDVAINELDAEVEVNSLVGDLALGNQWQFDRWAIGADWVGWMPHLRVLSSHDRYPYQNASAREQADKRSRFDSIAARGNPSLVRFYVGVAF